MSKVDVFLRVYTISDQSFLCFGFYHSGVEALGSEYSFASEAGIYSGEPGSYTHGSEKEVRWIGKETLENIRKTLDNLRNHFTPTNYHFLINNCNNFSSAFSRSLFGDDIPAYVNRPARFGSYFKMFLRVPEEVQVQESSLYRGEGFTVGGKKKFLDSNKTPLLSQRELMLQAAQKRYEAE